MKLFLLPLMSLIVLLSAGTAASDVLPKEQKMEKMRIAFAGGEVVVRLYDNPAARQLKELLPAEFEFMDFAGEEKIAEFPRPLSLKDAPRGMVASAGKMFIYAPWGNLGIFYRDHGTKVDNSLIPLGEVEEGLPLLQKHKGGFSAALEIVK